MNKPYPLCVWLCVGYLWQKGGILISGKADRISVALKAIFTFRPLVVDNGKYQILQISFLPPLVLPPSAYPVTNELGSWVADVSPPPARTAVFIPATERCALKIEQICSSYISSIFLVII